MKGKSRNLGNKKLGFKTQYLNINNDQIIKNPIEYQL